MYIRTYECIYVCMCVFMDVRMYDKYKCKSALIEHFTIILDLQKCIRTLKVLFIIH